MGCGFICRYRYASFRFTWLFMWLPIGCRGQMDGHSGRQNAHKFPAPSASMKNESLRAAISLIIVRDFGDIRLYLRA